VKRLADETAGEASAGPPRAPVVLDLAAGEAEPADLAERCSAASRPAAPTPSAVRRPGVAMTPRDPPVAPAKAAQPRTAHRRIRVAVGPGSSTAPRRIRASTRAVRTAAPRTCSAISRRIARRDFPAASTRGAASIRSSRIAAAVLRSAPRTAAVQGTWSAAPSTRSVTTRAARIAARARALPRPRIARTRCPAAAG
jgi:hypothetical protein